MSYKSRFSSLLIDELRNLDLLPTYDEYRIVNTSVVSQGQKELNNFRKAIGSLIWWKGFISTRQWYAYASYSAVAGWGCFLSTYVNAPLRLSRSENEAVGHLAALSLVIIAIYDNLLDRNGFQYPPVSPCWLNNLLKNDPALPIISEQSSSSSIHLVSRLIELFLVEVYKLPYVDERPEIFSLLKKSIVRMHEAENKTAMSPPHDVSKYILVRKSAFPFVIMGLTGWLASSYFDQRLFSWHLLWLYNLGSFFALIDDVVDVDHDKLKGHPNIFIHHVNVDSSSQINWAKKIACKGRVLHNQWHRRVYAKNKFSSDGSIILASCLASWLM